MSWTVETVESQEPDGDDVDGDDDINHLVLMICLTVTNLQVVLLGSIHSVSETSKTFIFHKLQEVAEDHQNPNKI